MVITIRENFFAVIFDVADGLVLSDISIDAGDTTVADQHFPLQSWLEKL